MKVRSMKVRTICECPSRQGMVLPPDSVVQDVQQLKNHYKGMWCSMFGSYTVTIPKKFCVRFHGW